MRSRRVVLILATSLVVGMWAIGGAADQVRQAGGGAASIPGLKTPWGEPDLQGIWDGDTLTPLERPERWADKPVLSEQEAAAVEQWVVSQPGRDDRSQRGTERDVAAAYNQHWLPPAQRLSDRRTGLIIDPPNGRVPEMTPEARKRTAEEREYLRALLDGSIAALHEVQLPHWRGPESCLHLMSFISLVDHDRICRIDHTVGDDHVATHRKTVHKYRVVRSRHLFLVNDPLLSEPRAMRDIRVGPAVEKTATPAFGVYDIDPIEGRFGVIRKLDTSAIVIRLTLDRGE